MLNPKAIRLLEAISNAQLDMELSEDSDQYMRELRQLIKSEMAQAFRHRFRPAFHPVGAPLNYCLLCKMDEDAKIEGRAVHAGFSRVILDEKGAYVQLVPKDWNNKGLKAGWRIDSVDDTTLGALINGEAVLPPNSHLVYADGMTSVVETPDE